MTSFTILGIPCKGMFFGPFPNPVRVHFLTSDFGPHIPVIFISSAPTPGWAILSCERYTNVSYKKRVLYKKGNSTIMTFQPIFSEIKNNLRKPFKLKNSPSSETIQESWDSGFL